MFAHMLAKVMAKIPPDLKYRLAKFKPIYNQILQFGSSVVEVRMVPGTVKWHIDRITTQQHLLGHYEQYTQDALTTWVRPGDIVYDVGAHAGFHTLYAALLVGEQGTVIAFEPHPYNATSIRHQCALNPKLRISLLEIALSDHSATTAMHVPGNTSQGFLNEEGELPVKAHSVDELLADQLIPPPNVIKIDVEGHEVQMLRGAATTIATYQPVLICDYNEGNTLTAVRQATIAHDYIITAEPIIVAVPRRHLTPD